MDDRAIDGVRDYFEYSAMGTINFFASESAAKRYAKGRPYFHPIVIERIKERLALTLPVQRALDVGCGTGLSTMALKEIAARVVGIDSSAEMIGLARADSNIEYQLANAEHLPFKECEFDLVTVSQAIHWLAKARFLQEARRVLRTEGWLIVYDNYFAGSDNHTFNVWRQESYLTRYPRPWRESPNFAALEIEKEGFQLIGDEVLRNTISFSLEGLIDFFASQSNIIAAVEGGDETIAEARAWLKENLERFFETSSAHDFVFSAPIWCLRRSD
ncbi:MAG TPA: methyltransferase domain-containing protein [Pyrinomonadaceae bacterium]|nr:methyltransferase domain-containing protein [Pyrinomonadaceae bacterium]